jgi:ABC-type lipoprotein release transport system permease subunit
LTYSYWRSVFGGDRSVLGRTIRLNGVPFTIVGVTEPDFTSLTPGKNQHLFLCLSILPRLNIRWATTADTRSPDNWWLVIVARLKAGTTIAKAQAAASLLFRNEMLNGDKPRSKASDDPRIVLARAQSGLSGGREYLWKPLEVLMFAVGFVLLIACANVAGLLLSRASARQKEIAVRLALGAGRGRMIRQLLTESLTLSLIGGGLGAAFASWGVHAMSALVLGGSQFVVKPDWRILLFTISVSLLTGILFGFAPALRGSQLDLTPALKENASSLQGGEPHAGRRSLLGKALVVVQVGLSMIVLIGAGLFVRTLQNLHKIDPGFDTRNMLLFGINPTLEKYSDSQIQSLYRNLQEQLSALPSVMSVSYSSNALVSGSLWTSDLHVEGQPQKKTDEIDMLSAGPNFLTTLRIPLLEGRGLTAADFELAARAAALDQASPQTASPSAASSPAPRPPESASVQARPPVPVLVNRAFARRYFPQENPLGKHLDEGDSSQHTLKSWEIVGVVGDTKNSTLRREVHPMAFLPLTEGGASFEVRTASNPSALVGAVREVAKRVDSNLPISSVRTQTEVIEGLLKQERMVARLASFFGLLALLLSCIGLYGLLSYEVARRTREIGIRMALGAERRDVLRPVAARGIKLTIAGLIAGIAAGLVLTRFLSSLLYEIKPADPTTIIAVSLLLAACALLASYVPARRATKVDPMVALRYE